MPKNYIAKYFLKFPVILNLIQDPGHFIIEFRGWIPTFAGMTEINISILLHTPVHIGVYISPVLYCGSLKRTH